jgi:UDP-N-acetylmuramate dehydrogenase
VLEWVNVCAAGVIERREPSQLELEYRRSNIRSDQVISRASFLLVEGDPDQIKRTMSEMRGKRREAQPSGIKTFGSTFKNPRDARAGGRTAGRLLEAAGCRGLQVGGARFSDKHANFVENAGDATTADILGLIGEGRRRVHERFGVWLEAEVQVLGDVEWSQDAGRDR